MTDPVFEDNRVGGPVRHVPVMLDEVLSVVQPGSGQSIVDGTFGAGGYSRALLEAGANVIGIDRDPDAVMAGRKQFADYGDRLNLVEGEFAELDRIAREAGATDVDAVVLDIGVSSMQLDQAERGFSFRNDGPLDMRMSQGGVSAEDVVNEVRQQDLTRIIGILGEEKKASKVSAAIVRARDEARITTTNQLAQVVAKAVGQNRNDRIHPATRTFQALRIFINRELEQLGEALIAAERLLKAGGRLAIVTFHSLEDRIVKRFFQDRGNEVQGSRHQPQTATAPATFQTGRKGLLKPGEAECAVNPRARSAKLRWGVRTEVLPREADVSIFGFPNLVPLTAFSSQQGGA